MVVQLELVKLEVHLLRDKVNFPDYQNKSNSGLVEDGPRPEASLPVKERGTWTRGGDVEIRQYSGMLHKILGLKTMKNFKKKGSLKHFVLLRL